MEQTKVMDRLEEIKEEEVNFECQKIRFKQAKSEKDKVIAQMWIDIVEDRLQALKRKR